MLNELTPAMSTNEARAIQNTNNAYLGEQATIDQIKIMSAAQTPTSITGTATVQITLPATANPYRLTLLLTSALTATSKIQLRVGTGSYYDVYSLTELVKSMSAGVPYDMVLTNIGGALRWVCLNADVVTTNETVNFSHAKGSIKLVFSRRGQIVSVASAYGSFSNLTAGVGGEITLTPTIPVQYRPTIRMVQLIFMPGYNNNRAAIYLDTGGTVRLTAPGTSVDGDVCAASYIV